MPIYEYKCNSCNKSFEHWQSGFEEDPNLGCQFCDSKDIAKQIHAPGIVFKGQGFYKTDSRGSQSITSPPKDSSTPSTSSNTKSDSQNAKAKKAKSTSESSKSTSKESKKKV